MTDEGAIRLKWEYKAEFQTWEVKVPAKDWRGVGHYHIFMQARPGYCDRGRWVANVDGIGISGLDDQEGFPRYYFSLEYAKAEMEAWVNMRDVCLANKNDGRTA